MFASVSWIQIGIGSIAAFALSWLLHTVDVNRIDNNWQDKLDAQKVEILKSCADDKKLTEDVSHDYQNKLAALNKQLSTIKLHQPSRCVMPIAGKASSGTGGDSKGKYVGQDGVDSDALYDYATTCEHYRLQVISMQDFISKVWQKNK